MEPQILFEDDSIIVLNKPAGMIVYPDQVHDYPALSDWLQKKYGEFHIVHRIDRETSGVLVVAKTAEAYKFLKNQFKNREVQKTYRAFVYGPLKDERGAIDKPIGSGRGGRGPRSARRPHGVERDALTLWRRISNSSKARGDGVCYVEVFPKTGRTHQIRVHFAAIQHPVVADQLYAPTRARVLGFERLALHALSIAFVHPNGRQLKFDAPLPADFIAAEKLL
ncbi:MAG: RluA family pseudouridine synthase [Patescibacteria group bacterium]|nr:RluA family pseudouridine synthase [Patescibacteria group bacterium]